MPSPLHQAHDPDQLARRWDRLSARCGLRMETLGRHDGHPIHAVVSPALAATGGLYLSAGIHGDEPASVQGLLAWAERQGKALGRLPVLILPCLNPWGLLQNRRTDAADVDVNRRWQTDCHPVVLAVRHRIRDHRFALALSLHEDYDATGVYIYEPHRARPLRSARSRQT